MKNFGFISKKKVAREIAKIYNERNITRATKEEILKDWEVQSSLNLLCRKLGIKPMHRNELGGGTGEMLRFDNTERGDNGFGSSGKF